MIVKSNLPCHVDSCLIIMKHSNLRYLLLVPGHVRLNTTAHSRSSAVDPSPLPQRPSLISNCHDGDANRETLLFLREISRVLHQVRHVDQRFSRTTSTQTLVLVSLASIHSIEVFAYYDSVGCQILGTRKSDLLRIQSTGWRQRVALLEHHLETFPPTPDTAPKRLGGEFYFDTAQLCCTILLRFS